jgi:glycosyltransferase involved in cell wall biosynthesis
MHVYFNSARGLREAQKAGVPLDAPQVIYSGIDLSLFPYRPRRPLASSLKLLLPGRVVEYKGVHDAIVALGILERLLPHVEISLHIVGPCVDEAYGARIQKQISDLRLQDKVTFTDLVTHDQMSQIYQEADICLLPTHQIEGLSRVPLEAMASGTVIIASGNEGSQELINDGVTGLLVPVASPDAIAQSIERMYRNPDLYVQLAENGRHSIEESFTIDRAVDEIEALLTKAWAEE